MEEKREAEQDEREVEAEEEDSEEAGKRNVLKMMNPRRPSQDEVDEHEITHIPFRSWCRHCVLGRGKEAPHKKMDGAAVDMPEIHWDFMFLGEENDAKNTVAILVAKERTTKMGMSSVVPNKSTGAFLCRRSLAYMHEVGVASGDVTMKSDQEPAMLSILRDIGKERSLRRAGATC